MQTDRLSDRGNQPTLDRMVPVRAIFHIGIVLGLSGPINPNQTKALKIEVAEIWRPYGIAIAWFEPNGDCGSHDQVPASPVDWMVQVSTDAPQRSNAVLGDVRFHAGIPDHIINLRYAPLSQMMLQATVGSWVIGSLPPPMRDRLVGQALGRVVAHELGHVLLALPVHDRSGLMRPAFAASDLVGGRDQFRLSATNRQRLDKRLSRLVSP